jgi:hypothetical protein
MTALTGLRVSLPDSCRCSARLTVVTANNVLTCCTCRRRRDILSSFTAKWLSQVVQTFGPSTAPIVFRDKSILAANAARRAARIRR